MSNQLKNETSPYLLQHAENPVNWYPWCDAAFAKAKAEDKPIFLSIGYSTCHWCHVMAHESFEDEATAALLNQYFVAIKVDREERPDIDSVYMSVCQTFTGSGGWPMSIFMTWDKKPFFAGTYFPVHSKYGMPGFGQLLTAVAEQWRLDRTQLLQSAEQVMAHLIQTSDSADGKNTQDLAEQATLSFVRTFDSENGGFGSAPKFPTPHNLLFLMLQAKLTHDQKLLEMAEKTLLQMRKGGIFDHIGYGFARYSTDPYFLAPHFEKMLYDNALLMMAYATAYDVTDHALYLDTAEKTAAYILREMTHPQGGFYSAQDADSEGVEGKYYTFTHKEIMDVLGKERGAAFACAFDITEQGNFEGVNIPNLLQSSDFSDFTQEIETLYTYRKNRFALHLDDKILLSWNSLMISALSLLYRISQKEPYLDAARKAGAFVEQYLCEGENLYTSFRDGNHSGHGFLDDYAFYIAAQLSLYSATLEQEYLQRAEQLCTVTLQRFADRARGGYFLSQNNELFLNPKETYDGAIPSGNAVMAYNFVKLYQLTKKEEYSALAEQQLAFLAAKAQDYPGGHCMFLLAKLLYENPPQHITVVLSDDAALRSIRQTLPLDANITVIPADQAHPLLNGQTTYYVCKDHTCYPPTNTL